MSDRSSIAIIGLACRLPGASDPNAFWRLLREGASAIADVPDGRWQDTPGAEPLPPGARRGGFLESVDRFDADFFGISPLEAAATDPQQRLMLELCWEAFEDSAVVPAALRDTPTGVFVGAIADDYAELMRALGAERDARHALTGLHRGMIANRVSYALGLRGPSLTVDTGQSSSLVAVHLACESLRRGESELALAGGVHLNLTSAGALRAARFGALSPDGHCYAFDARANGYVRGEGGAVVVLKPLAAALADGDPVHCVIRGSAVNNDGGGDGLTAPHQPAQEEVLRLACRRAGIRRADVAYVELHGTGTPLGDRVEAAALGAVLGAARPAGAPLAVGSAKTNIGHLEGAAGVVGLVKAALGIAHGELPPSLNFESPAPEVPLERLRLRVQRELGSWPVAGAPRVAGINSFGLGGTNCHVVVSAPPAAVGGRVAGGRASAQGVDSGQAARAAGAKATTPTVDEGAGPLGGGARAWVLAGRTEAALRAQAARLARHLEERPELGAADVAHALAVSRSAFEHRAVVLGRNRDELLEGVRALAAGRPAPGVVEGRVSAAAAAAARGDGGREHHDGGVAEAGVVFVFPGQGTQWRGMALELLDASPVFARSIDACANALAPHVEWSLRDALCGVDGLPGLERIEVVQPVLFAVMVSLAELWRACGVRPAAVVGHSQGEIAAACVAGGLSLQDAARVVALRSQLLSRLAGQGGVASLGAPLERVRDLLARWDGRIAVGGVNGPRAVGVVGELPALGELVELCAAESIPARIVAATVASHSPAVEPLRDDLLEALAEIAPRPGTAAFYSTVTAGSIDTVQLGPEYWYRNMRQPIRFEAVVRALLAEGAAALVEVSPHPVLTVGMQETVDVFAAGDGDEYEHGEQALVHATLRRGQGGTRRFLEALAETWVHGLPVDWGAILARPGVRRVELPTYAFQRKRHWLAPSERAAAPVAPQIAAAIVESSAGAPVESSAGAPAESSMGASGEALTESPPAHGLRGLHSSERGRIVLELVRSHTAA
ncbi:MAG TPA: type I polyketide synthase, partial [Solirubrobacteraceae bacterium]|nr:type I polyketide synthase [Solirubrobacteraceae bacterium]